MRHHNKALFSVKHIERDVEFKSIMCEVCCEMEIEMNYTNPDYHFPEAYSDRTVGLPIHDYQC